MLQNLSPEIVSIHKIEDLLFIEVQNDTDREAEYSIQFENDKIIRRGRFKGRLTQLSLTHLAAGCYKLFLTSDSEHIITFPFEKRTTQLFYRWQGHP